MKKSFICLLLALCTCSIAGHGQTNTTPNQKAARKLVKKQQKLARKGQKQLANYYKAQQKAQQKAQRKAMKQAKKQQKNRRRSPSNL